MQLLNKFYITILYVCFKANVNGSFLLNKKQKRMHYLHSFFCRVIIVFLFTIGINHQFQNYRVLSRRCFSKWIFHS